MYHFLTGCRLVGHDWLNRGFGTLAEQVAQLLFFHAEDICHSLSAGQHANGDTGIRVAFNVVEHHGRAVHFGRPHNGAACTHIAVHTGKLCFRVYFYVRFHQLPRCLA